MIHPSALPLDPERARRVVRSFGATALTNDALDCELLQDIAEGLARSVSAGQLPPGGERRWIRLLDTRSYDAWLIGWPPGTGLDLHDHGESSAALCVVEGSLDEHHLSPLPPGGVMTRQLGAGDALAFGSAHVHAMHNSSDVEALSVHVYSPPLSTMTFFEQGAGSQLFPLDAALVDLHREPAPRARAAV
jgi:Cysteine dioxygenase type I